MHRERITMSTYWQANEMGRSRGMRRCGVDDRTREASQVYQEEILTWIFSFRG